MNATRGKITSQTKRFAAVGFFLAGALLSVVLAQAGETVPWKGTRSGHLIPTDFGYPFFAVAEAGEVTHVGKFSETGTPALPGS